MIIINRKDGDGGVTVEPVTFTEDGVYTAPSGKAYSPVTVNTGAFPPVIKRKTGNPIELSDAAAAPIVKCVTEIQGSQDLHGYDKPWVGGAGKNKLDESTKVVNYYLNDSGVATYINDAAYYNQYIPVVANQQITVSFHKNSTANFYVRIHGYNSLKNWVALIFKTDTTVSPIGDYQYTITIPSDISYIMFSFGNDLTYAQIEIGSTATTFSPYSNICPITAYTEGEIEVRDGDGNTTTHTTTYPSAIYRGSEDVVNGEVTKEWPLIDLGDLTWQKTSVSPAITRFYTYDISTLIKTPTAGTQKANIICENFSTESANDLISGSVDNCIAVGTTGTLIARVSGEDSLTAEQFKTYVTGIKLAYELATPATTPVTPTNLPIKSLSGYNHIESTTGDMVIDYITDAYQNFVDTVESALPNTRKGGAKAMDVFLSLEKKDDKEEEVKEETKEDMK